MKRLEKLVARYEATKKRYEGIETYWADHNNGFSVNVKLHDKFLTSQELEDVLYEVVLTSNDIKLITDNAQAQKEFNELKNRFTDSYVDSLFWNWVEQEGTYIDEILDGCRNASWGYWDGVITEVKAGKASGYPYIDRRKTIESKTKELERWKKKDALELRYCGIIKELGYGFYGRQAGHFVVFGIEKVGSLLEDTAGDLIGRVQADDYGDDIEKTSFMDDASTALDDANYYLDAIEWILGEVKSIRDGMDFKDEIKFRADEILENEIRPEILEEIEVADAKRIAEKYGYFICKKV